MTIVKFGLNRTLLDEKGQLSGSTYRWHLNIRFETEERDHENWYTDPVGTTKEFDFFGRTYSELVRTTFKRRGEIQTCLSVAEDVAGLLWRSRLHAFKGLKSHSWFEELLTVLGLLENFSHFGLTHPEWIEWKVLPWSFVPLDFDEKLQRGN